MHYSFNGWFYEGEVITNATIVSTPSNHVLTAHWTVNKYPMTFNANGGEFMDTLDMLMLDEDVPVEMYVELYYYLADTSHRTGRDEQAQRHLREGLALDPDDEDLNKLAQTILPQNL